MVTKAKIAALIGSSVLLLNAYARAEATGTAAVGILAGAGVGAASGRTTLGAGAGVIEAGVLTSTAFQQAGGIIASIANAGRKGRPVLVLAHDEKLDLVSTELIRNRLDQLSEVVPTACKLPTATPRTSPFEAFGEVFGPNTLRSSDLATVGQTEQAIGGIALTADDRLLVNAVVMSGGAAPPATQTHNGWQVTEFSEASEPALSPAFIIPGEPVGYIATSKTLAAYNRLIALLTKQRQTCTSSEGKAAIAVADSYITALNAGSDKGAAPLLAALQTESALSGNPLILRLAVEQVGGTSIARAGFLYAVGWPNAATVGAGLKVSFRLIDPYAASLIAVGEVRCAVKQTNIKRLPQIVGGTPDRRLFATRVPAGETVCASRVAALPTAAAPR